MDRTLHLRSWERPLNPKALLRRIVKLLTKKGKMNRKVTRRSFQLMDRFRNRPKHRLRNGLFSTSYVIMKLDRRRSRRNQVLDACLYMSLLLVLLSNGSTRRKEIRKVRLRIPRYRFRKKVILYARLRTLRRELNGVNLL